MLYAEAAYFDGAHVQHIADYHEHLRLERLRQQARKRGNLLFRSGPIGGPRLVFVNRGER